MVSSLLNQRTLEHYVEIFDRRSLGLTEKLRPLADGQIFDIFHLIEGCTIDICCETVMGYSDSNALSNPNHEFVYRTAQMYKIVYDRMIKIWLHPDWIFRMTSSYKKQRCAKNVINDFTERCIEVRRQEMYNGQVGISILHRLLAANESIKELSDEELRDEIYTVYIAAQDTLAVTSSFAVLMLGIHKNIQDKARNEVNDMIGDQSITAECLSKLKYIDMIIKETLRLFPIAPLMTRRLNGELQLDNYTLPKDCEIVIACYGTHRSSKYWEKSNEFIPERFDSNEVSKRHPYVFIPFSAGPMGCIGKKFAILSIKAVLVNILRKYEIQSNVNLNDVKLKVDISIRSVDGYKVSLKPL